jgi:hypothetical protein
MKYLISLFYDKPYWTIVLQLVAYCNTSLKPVWLAGRAGIIEFYVFIGI